MRPTLRISLCVLLLCIISVSAADAPSPSSIDLTKDEALMLQNVRFNFLNAQKDLADAIHGLEFKYKVDLTSRDAGTIIDFEHGVIHLKTGDGNGTAAK